jgi:LAO/AO transport system kinase
LVLSALEGLGIEALWSTLLGYHADREQTGALAARRAGQRKAWFEAALDERLHEVFKRDPQLVRALAAAEQEVESGALSAPDAAQRLVATLLARR